ncbi:MAG: phosphoribosyl-ATP pyrophosphohydrolase [Alphaproteobacteria bacterium]|jgi:predicted house-cleaning noncanonical NTP pyrophosphatase (MazG superfamily)|nr:nucleoside triphosphate pyrophosphohydrolase [Alphaproteobacteria bacterium]
MATFIFNKLVRDRIPDIADAKGHKVRARVLDPQDLSRALLQKLQEELDELCLETTREGRVKELADVREVLDALEKSWGIEEGAVEAAQRQKAQTHGAFAKGVYLETFEVSDAHPEDLAYFRARPHQYKELT